MEGYINGFDWKEAEAMKYWSFGSSISLETRQKTVKDAIFSSDYIGSMKVDGYYERLLKDEDGNCFMVARSRNVNGEIVNKIDWAPQVKEWMDLLPNGTCVLSECYLPGNEGSKNITSILGCLKEKAIARQEKTPLHFYIFDVMAYNGQNLTKVPFVDRVKYLKTLSAFKSDFVSFAQYFEGEELWSNLQSYLANGREGVVIMRKDAPVYFKRTPARVSIKIKKELKETLDVVIIGANAPTREYNGKEIETWKYWENTKTGEKILGEHFMDHTSGLPIEPVTKAYFNGWAGSLIIGAKKDGQMVQIGSLSGITEEVLSNWRAYLGKVIEITGMQIMDTGGIRHPKLVQFRDDLTPNDTDWYRIFK